MTKIVYNACHGGFSLSEAGLLRYAELKGLTLYPDRSGKYSGLTTYWTVPPEARPTELEGEAWHRASQEERIAANKAYSAATISSREIDRADPALVQVVEELGADADGAHARLRVAEVPTGGKYRIDEYDGAESVETPDSYDWLTA